MLLVSTELRPSGIHGLGLFALEDIPKGTVIWRFQVGFDTVISLELLATLPPCQQTFVRHYGYLSAQRPNAYVMCNDDSRFMNHTEPSNTDNTAAVEVSTAGWPTECRA